MQSFAGSLDSENYDADACDQANHKRYNDGNSFQVLNLNRQLLLFYLIAIHYRLKQKYYHYYLIIIIGMTTSYTAKLYYPEDIECVHDSVDGKGAIYISNIEAAQNVHTLKKLNIKAILTAAAGASVSHSKTDIPFYKYIPGQDHEKFDLSKYFQESADFINVALKETNILVHCMAGISRSVTLVIAYMIKYKGMSYESSYALVKSRRRIIHPNDGFIMQLKKYQQERKGYDSPNKQRKDQYESPIKKYLKESPVKQDPYVSKSPKKYESPLLNYEPPKRYESPARKYQTNSPSKYTRTPSPTRTYDYTRHNQNKTLKYDYDGGKKLIKDHYLRQSVNEAKTPTKTNKETVENIMKKQINRSTEGEIKFKASGDIDKKIADIRKKYSDMAQELRIPIKEEQYSYKLKHMKSMNYNDENLISPSRNAYLDYQRKYDNPETPHSFRKMHSMNQSTPNRLAKY